jgi:hypothetical protein
VSFGLHSWPAPLQALALVANPSLGLQHMQRKNICFVGGGGGGFNGELYKRYDERE